MTTLPLIVAQYQAITHALGQNKKHWSIVALESRSHAHIFELHGTPLCYSYTTRFETTYHKAPHLRGGYQVGFIQADKLEWLREKLRELPIMNDDIEWFNSHVWVISALQFLKEEGLISGDVGYGHVRRELEQEMQRWEVADHTVEERLFP